MGELLFGMMVFAVLCDLFIGCFDNSASKEEEERERRKRKELRRRRENSRSPWWEE